MSLVWPASEAAIVTNQPRLHAFVVGVADYPHLNGGAGPLALDPLGLSQISTPRHTAPAIAGWLLGAYNNPACPLGSVELLVSPAAQLTLPKAGTRPVESATKARVKASFNRWQARCTTRSDNIAFFYFCGHGLEKSAQFLLPDDFGDPATPNRWENCIDFDGMRTGMRSCAADTQLFFVDACRETPFGVLAQLNVTGDPLITATVTDSVNCSAAYYATTQTRQAYGPDNGVTYFAQAVLSCLNGVAGLNKQGRWIVDTFSLGGAIGQVMTQLARRYRLPLTCNPNVSGMGVIHEAASPRVFAAVGCTSDAANNAAEIVLSKGPVVIRSAPGQVKPIVQEVDAGNWSIDVRFPGGQFPAQPPQQYMLMPPVFEGVPVP